MNLTEIIRTYGCSGGLEFFEEAEGSIKEKIEQAYEIREDASYVNWGVMFMARFKDGQRMLFGERLTSSHMDELVSAVSQVLPTYNWYADNDKDLAVDHSVNDYADALPLSDMLTLYKVVSEFCGVELA